jgi:F0F1-type ATP synthase alpha subunit
MDMAMWVTIVGTVASILGALVSFTQAAKSKSAADLAGNIKTQLISHKETSELTKVQSSCKTAQRAMAKYGPGSTPEGLIGVDKAADAATVQEFLSVLIEHRDYFGSVEPNKADDFHKQLSDFLDKFSLANDQNQAREHGKLIVMSLDRCSAEIKKSLDDSSQQVRV